MKMLLVSEGPRDIGRSRTHDGDAASPAGALTVLVRRLLGEHFRREIHGWEIDCSELARVHEHSGGVSGFARKVQLAVVVAAARGYSCAAVVVDRDGPANSGRIGELRKGRELAEGHHKDLADHTALGVAVETVEAWLLADEWGINEALHPTPPATECSPESLGGRRDTAEHPKTRFLSLVGTTGRTPAEAYDLVASAVRLDVVERACPQGFAPFATELRTRSR